MPAEGRCIGERNVRHVTVQHCVFSRAFCAGISRRRTTRTRCSWTVTGCGTTPATTTYIGSYRARATARWWSWTRAGRGGRRAARNWTQSPSKCAQHTPPVTQGGRTGREAGGGAGGQPETGLNHPRSAHNTHTP